MGFKNVGFVRHNYLIILLHNLSIKSIILVQRILLEEKIYRLVKESSKGTNKSRHSYDPNIILRVQDE